MASLLYPGQSWEAKDFDPYYETPKQLDLNALMAYVREANAAMGGIEVKKN